jgi:hypothetical protein
MLDIIAGVAIGLATPSNHTLNRQFHASVVDAGYKRCRTEDQVTACYWNANKRGNGRGLSFVVTDDGEVFYANGRTGK